MKAWLKDRLQEPSTYRGISLLLGAAGVYVDPAALEVIVSGVLALVGVVETVRKEGDN